MGAFWGVRRGCEIVGARAVCGILVFLVYLYNALLEKIAYTSAERCPEPFGASNLIWFNFQHTVWIRANPIYITSSAPTTPRPSITINHYAAIIEPDRQLSSMLLTFPMYLQFPHRALDLQISPTQRTSSQASILHCQNTPSISKERTSISLSCSVAHLILILLPLCHRWKWLLQF